MIIKELQDEIIDEFAMFDDWMERYEYIIEMGKSLPLIESQDKTNDNLIFFILKNCLPVLIKLYTVCVQ